MAHDDNLMTETDDRQAKYRAPALEKGLDVLELLAAASRPLTLSQISSGLNRSVSELFRMVQVLQTRGYVSDSPHGEGFELSNKLFSLGINRGPTQNLLQSALPLMQALCDETRQSCHLAIAHESRMVVIARIEAPGDLGFSVRVGFQRDLVVSTSGVVLFAFQPERVRAQWGERLRRGTDDAVWERYAANTALARAQGYFTQKSSYTDGITDLSCPVRGDSGVLAALTIPFIRTADGTTHDDALERLKATADTLSRTLGG